MNKNSQSNNERAFTPTGPDMEGARHQQVLAATLAAGFFANPNITKSLEVADIQGVYNSCFKIARLITE